MVEGDEGEVGDDGSDGGFWCCMSVAAVMAMVVAMMTRRQRGVEGGRNLTAVEVGDGVEWWLVWWGGRSSGDAMIGSGVYRLWRPEVSLEMGDGGRKTWPEKERRAVRRETTIVVAVGRWYSHHSRTMWCRAMAAQPLGVPRYAQPLDATTVAATEPAVATTAAPWWCRACGGICLLAWMGQSVDIEGRGLGELYRYNEMFSKKLSHFVAYLEMSFRKVY
nr:hypothetical protein [Tanacetum cinerariifolium]